MNKALYVVFLAMALDAVGIGIIMPILPGLLREVTGTDDVAPLYGLLLATFALMQFFCAPVLGALSDRYGRRPVLLLSLVGGALDYLALAWSPNIWVVAGGRILAGITSANMAVITAYITDTTEEAGRAKQFGRMSAAFGVGFIAGPALGGLLGMVSLRAPFLLAAGLNGLNFLLALLVLPESRPAAAERTPIKLGALNAFGSLRWAASVPVLARLLVVYVLAEGAGQLAASLWVLNGQDRFAWDASVVGWSLAGFGFLHAIAQTFVTEPVTRRLGERGAFILAAAADGVAYAVMAFATHGLAVFLIMPLLSLGGIVGPALQALMSFRVGQDRQGELQGTLAALGSLVGIGGPLLFTAVYGATRAIMPGAVWLLGVAAYAIAVPLLPSRRALAPTGAPTGAPAEAPTGAPAGE
ncbi:DHA1 family tetracycline resistance protein-like MFS transporter [Nitrospirillum amazonense]|uniref:DHA1 family tetracycline resistance protein-like MFS transporter n=1 Tax=Nitrospirillum amazonense TaxID=28077 RepID=A0A560FAQ1_9PROT|nr:TCR/Tet family MFS transporter [Nitrospirillum amazonense]TWB18691.1 DHA1 family tetracycline resistance protein-like MFS transporter [Nitrospirillum amazonense]